MRLIDPTKREAIKTDLHERFTQLCSTSPDGCWTWNGTIQESGLGVISVCGKQYSAHRVSAWVYLGDETEPFDLEDSNVMVERTCDSDRCVNYEHLALKRIHRKKKEGEQSMKLVCERKTLVSACRLAGPAVSGRDVKPILRNVKIVADDTGCRMSATDLEVGIVATLPPSIRVENEGESLWPHARLSAIVGEMDDETLTLNFNGESCEVKGARAEFDLPSQKPEEFPDIDANGEFHHEVDALTLRTAIRRTLFAAASVEHSRYGATSGVKFEFGVGNEGLSLIATDGRRLARVAMPAEAIIDKKLGDGLVVPQRAMSMLERAISDIDPSVQNATVQIAFSANDVRFKLPQCTIYSRLVEGRFPQWRQVIPKDLKRHARIKAGELLTAIRQAAIMTDVDSVRVEFTFNNGKLSMKSSGAETGKSYVETPCEYIHPKLTIAFAPHFLAPMLKAVPDDADVDIKMADAQTPAVFSVGDDYQYVVVPLVAAETK